MIQRIIIIAFIFSFVLDMSAQKKYEPTWESLDSRACPEWFQDAKFGIFIHWGIYSVPAWRKVSNKLYASYAEWYYARVMYDSINGGENFHRKNWGKDFEYRDFAPYFKAELYDPDWWAEVFKRSGAQYVVLTSKHHDGYCLWPTDSKYKENWNSMDIGPERDLVGDLTTAVRKRGMKMGLYYSIVEWETTPTERTKSGYFLPQNIIDKYQIPRDEYVADHIIPQLQHLVIKYEPAVIFADGGEWDGDEDSWQTKEFLSWLYNNASNKNEVVVNDRWCKGMPGNHGDYYSSEYEDTDAIGMFHPWEESRGIGGSYGYNRDENIDDYNSSEELVHELIDIVSRGGNLLLNVGPTADGRIPVIMQQRLIDIGEWLKINGEAIFGTNALSAKEISSILGKNSPTPFLTKKDKDLYLIYTDYPEKDIVVKGIDRENEIEVNILGYNNKITYKRHNDLVIINLPGFNPDKLPSKYAWVIKITNGLSD